MAMYTNNYNEPSFQINEDICRSNIRKMAEKARANQLIFRPHFKTHQSLAVGEWFRDEGVAAITVSSVKMARFFADGGWKDITIAFPANILQFDEISKLASEIRLNLLFDMKEQAAFFARNLRYKAGFYIKTDTGYHRSGVDPADTDTINHLLAEVSGSNLKFKGFLTHSGHTYHANDRDEILAIHAHSSKILSNLKQSYLSGYPEIITSTGDTPSCSIGEKFAGIDEIRPGNFVFYDLMQWKLGSCSFKEIGAVVVCPVISVYCSRKEALIYGGAVHLSKERLNDPAGKPVYGLIVPFSEGQWQAPEGDDYIVSLSQEHGIFRMSSKWANGLKPGDLVAVIPVHSCLAADLSTSCFIR
jgi:D-serine deaminase-like pyridoxal phosphate-dependent protein